MRIIGIDPGLALTGIGLLTTDGGQEMLDPDWLTIETAAGGEKAKRLCEIATDLSALLDDEKPEIAIVEKLFFETNVKTAIDVAEARGVILSVVASKDICIIEPTPMQLKSTITGDGRADKRQMQDMVMRILSLQTMPTPDDAADGLALALYGCYSNTNAMQNAEFRMQNIASK